MRQSQFNREDAKLRAVARLRKKAERVARNGDGKRAVRLRENAEFLEEEIKRDQAQKSGQ